MDDASEKVLRYTKIQRNKEAKVIHNKKITKMLLGDINKCVTTEYKEYVDMNTKSCTLEECRYNIKKRSNYYTKIKEQDKYEENIIKLAKMRYRGYIKKEQSIQKFIQAINNKYKKVDKDIYIIYGDWSENPNIKFNTPTIRDKLREKLEKHFKVIMMDEYNTSKTDCMSGNAVGSVNKKDGSNDHMVLECTTLNKNINDRTANPIKIRICRDKNAVKNFKNILRGQYVTGRRPPEYCRSAA
jgi:hypothetical protein